MSMDKGAEFLQYMELQGSLDMVTKSELLDTVKRRGARISERQLTTYITEGVLPESARIGTRSGAYPKIVTELLWWVTSAREQGLSIKAIKELIPVWRYLVDACHRKELSLTEFEFMARQHVTMPEAMFAIPMLLLATMPCPSCQGEHLAETKLIDKDNTGVLLDGAVQVTVDFVVAQRDEDGTVRRLARMPVPLSVPREDPAYRVVLGLPVGVELPEQEALVSVGESRGTGLETEGA